MSFLKSLLLATLASLMVLLTTSQAAIAQSVEPSKGMSPAELASDLSDLDLQIEAMADAKQRTHVRLDEMRVHLQELQAKQGDLFQQQDALGISKTSYEEIMRSLQTQRVQLTIDLAGIEARRQALTERHETPLGSESDLLGAAHESLKELENIQSVRLRQIEALHGQGAAASDDVLTAKQQLLEVQVRLAEFARPGSVHQQALDNELLDVSLTRAETAARLTKVNELLQEYVLARTPLHSLNRVQAEMDSVQTQFSKLNDNAARQDDQLNDYTMRRAMLQKWLEQAEGKSGDEDND